MSASRPRKRGAGRRRPLDRSAALLLCGVMLLLGAASARAHQDPPGCSATGVTVVIEVVDADQTTPHPVSEPVSDCETICYRVVLSKPTTPPNVCAFDGGVLTLTTPDAVAHNVTPAPTPSAPRGIPCIGGTEDDPPIAFCDPETTSFTSGFVCYRVRPQDIDGEGMVVADVDYAFGNAHTRDGDLLSRVFATQALPLTVEPCPADTACRDNFCDPTLEMDGQLGLCDFTDLTDTVCRMGKGECDVPEVCVEGQTECPPDQFVPGGEVCRPGSGDQCDPQEVCPGNGPNCPPDVVAPPTQQCRPGSGDVCDPPEVCPGTPGGACPPNDNTKPSTFQCRPGSGDVCDPPELCPGTPGGACPPNDNTKPSTFECRPGSGDVCDPPELCPGTPGGTCPPNSNVKPSSFQCRPGSGDVCDPPEQCPGTPGSMCPPNDNVKPSSFQCRPGSGDVCDPPESCPGTPGGTCPPNDNTKPPTFVCREGSGDLCDPDELCPGTPGGRCPTDVVRPPTVECGEGSGDKCLPPEHCPGESGAPCPVGEPAPDGTPCSDEDTNVCAPAVCEDGACVRGETEVGCGDLPTAPCQVAVDNPPGTFASLRAAVNAAANGTTITVSGLCEENVTISGRKDLTIQGAFTASTCPPAGLRPGDLLAALRGSLQIRSSTGIDVRFLDIVESRDECVRLRSGHDNTLHCNCLSLCRAEGIDVSGAKDSEISRNLIKDNGDDGIALSNGAEGISVLDNVVQFNGDDGIDVEASENLIRGNDVSFNGHDGIDLDLADDNRVLGNDVIRNGCLPSKSEDSGIEVRNSDDNEFDGNVIRNNPDGELDTIFCRGGSDDNFGSNVPAKSRCR